jgi:hypothetical protein
MQISFRVIFLWALLGFLVVPGFSQRGIEFNLAFSKDFLQQINKIVIGPQGDKIAVAAVNSHLSALNFEGKEIWSRIAPGKILDMRFNRSGSTLLVAIRKEGVFLAEYSTGAMSLINKKISYPARICYSPDDSLYAVAEDNSWSIFAGNSDSLLVIKEDAHKKEIIFMDFISNARLITIGKDYIIRIWDAQSGREVQNYQVFPTNILAAALSVDKNVLLIGTYDFTIDRFAMRSSIPRQTDLQKIFKLKIINAKNLSLIKEIDGTSDYISSLSLSADNKFAAVLKEDHSIDVWGLENGYVIKTFPSEADYVDLQFDQEGKSIALATSAGQFQEWETRGIVVVSSRPSYVGEKFKINTPTSPLITRSQSGITIAIIDFSSALIDPQISEAVSSLFRNRISNYSYISVVERDELNTVFKEQGLQQSGITTAEKAAEIGKLLNAQKLVMGKLSSLGSTLILSVKVVDVESAKLEGAREIECENYALENSSEMIDILVEMIIEK